MDPVGGTEDGERYGSDREDQVRVRNRGGVVGQYSVSPLIEMR
jgi:hypothetical protein